MDAIYAARPSAAWELVDTEAVVINFDTRHYFSLNPTATAVWTALSSGPQTLDTMSAALESAYGVPASDVRADVAELVQGLVVEGLVQESDEPVVAAPAVEQTDGAYVAPRFDKFGTLEQLIVAGE